MKDLDTKEKFINLRAKGWSFDKIAAKINVSKPTLIKWGGELRKELNNVKYLHYQSLLEQNAVSNRMRIEFLIKELKKINDAIEKKDYEDLPLKDLHALREKIDNDLNRSLSHVKYSTGEKISVLEDFAEIGVVDETIPLDV